WTWQDRAEGSIPRGTALDPSVDPIPGVRAYPTAYLPERMLVSVTPDDDDTALDRDLKTLAEAAASFGWRIGIAPVRPATDAGATDARATDVGADAGVTDVGADAGTARSSTSA